jgi:hypothetical protein
LSFSIPRNLEYEASVKGPVSYNRVPVHLAGSGITARFGFIVIDLIRGWDSNLPLWARGGCKVNRLSTFGNRSGPSVTKRWLRDRITIVDIARTQKCNLSRI